MQKTIARGQTLACNICKDLTGHKDGLCLKCDAERAKEYRDKYEEPQAATACSHCGSVEDVVMRWRYMGGHGYQWTPDCRSKPDCWQRQDEQMGLEHKPLIKAGE